MAIVYAKSLVFGALVALATACSSSKSADDANPGNEPTNAGTGSVASAGRSQGSDGGSVGKVGSGGAGGTGGAQSSAGSGGASPSYVDSDGTWSAAQLLDEVAVFGALWAARGSDGSMLAVWRVGLDNSSYRYSYWKDGAWSTAAAFVPTGSTNGSEYHIAITPGPNGDYYVRVDDTARVFSKGAWGDTLTWPKFEAFAVDDAERALLLVLRNDNPGSGDYAHLYGGFDDAQDSATLLVDQGLVDSASARYLGDSNWLVGWQMDDGMTPFATFDGTKFSTPVPASTLDIERANRGPDGRLWGVAAGKLVTFALSSGFSAPLDIGQIDTNALVVPIANDRAAVLAPRGSASYPKLAAFEAPLARPRTSDIVIGSGVLSSSAPDGHGGGYFCFESPGIGGSARGAYVQRYVPGSGLTAPVHLVDELGAVGASQSIVLPTADGSADVIVLSQVSATRHVVQAFHYSLN